MFFAGGIFAPKATYSTAGKGDKNVGEVLQDAYINAFQYVARRLAGLECILGWDVMNEPHPGFIGLKSLKYWNEDTELHLGVMANGVQGMVLASGGEEAPQKSLVVKLPIYHRSWPRPSTVSGYVDYQVSQGPRVWADGRADIWREEGVWWWDESSKEGYSCKPDYFTKDPKTGSLIDFERDFYEPFLRKFLAAVREGRKQGLKDLGMVEDAGMGQWSFIEPVPNIGPPNWVEEDTAEVKKETNTGGIGVCYAPHWYDLRACFEKRLSYSLSFDVGALALGSRNFFRHSYFGRLGLLGNYKSQFTRLVSHLPAFRKSGKPTPVLVGETGMPFDINEFAAYKTGNVHWQLVMLDSVVGAMERVGKGNLNWALWNFTSENYVTVDPKSKMLESGDGWNSEDFSLVSKDSATTEVSFLPQSPPPHENCRTTTVIPNNNGTPLTRAKAFGDFYTGARCIGAWVRPYPAKVAGILLHSQFTLANIDAGTRECWGGAFEMQYTASGGSDESKVARTTEIFIPAYHFGGQPWALQICASQSHKNNTPLATILVKTAESSEILEVPSVPGGQITFTYSESAQSLNIMHTGQLEGCFIRVVAEVGIPRERGSQDRTLKRSLVLLALGVVGVVLGMAAASVVVAEVLKTQKVEYWERGY